MRILFLILLCINLGFSHGLFYSAKEGKAIIINANFTTKTPASYAKILIYKGESAIPLVKSKMDSNGNFAFLPPQEGEYKIHIIASSDHGEHHLEFKLNANKDEVLEKYETANFQKYFGVLSAIGIIFGIFGLIALIKTRRSK